MPFDAPRKRNTKDCRHFVSGSDARIIIGADDGTSDHDASLAQQWGEKARKPGRADPRNPPQNLNQHWYAAITGGMPLRWYIVAVCYGTIVILLGLYPWGVLLVLLSRPCSEEVSSSHGGHNER